MAEAAALTSMEAVERMIVETFCPESKESDMREPRSKPSEFV